MAMTAIDTQVCAGLQVCSDQRFPGNPAQAVPPVPPARMMHLSNRMLPVRGVPVRSERPRGRA